MFEDLRKGYYSVIVADPAWTFKTYSETRQTRAAKVHYDVMTLDDIKEMPVSDLSAPDCALLLWVCNPMLPQGLEVMQAWGFTFKTIVFCWAKTSKSTHYSWAPKYHLGMGYYSRQNVELCLLGTRGKPKRVAKDVRQLLVEPVREHSRKPEKFFTETERLFPGPYVELFSRQPRPHWDAWGKQVGKFEPPSASLDITPYCE